MAPHRFRVLPALALFAFGLLCSPKVAAAEHVAQHWHNVFLQERLAPSSQPASSSAALYYLEVQPRLTLWPGGAPDKVLFRGALGLGVARRPPISVCPPSRSPR